MRNFPLLLLLFALGISCSPSEKEKDITIREKALLTKELEFNAKEAEYLNLVAMRDSLQNAQIEKSSAATVPAEILGMWNGKMVCMESTCAEHVIGDQRTDIWEFTNEGLRMVNKSGGERLFTAKVEGTQLRLNSEESPNINNSTEITLDLTISENGRLKGVRKLTGKDGCIATFSVDLEKTKN